MCSVERLPAPLEAEALTAEQAGSFESEMSPMGSSLCFAKRSRAFAQMREDPSRAALDARFAAVPVERKAGGMDQAKLDSMAVDGGECAAGLKNGLPQSILDSLCVSHGEEVPEATGGLSASDQEELLFLVRRKRAAGGRDAAAAFMEEVRAAHDALLEEAEASAPAEPGLGLSQARLNALSVSPDAEGDDAESSDLLLRVRRARAFRGAEFAAAFAEKELQKAVPSASTPEATLASTTCSTAVPADGEPESRSSPPRTPRQALREEAPCAHSPSQQSPVQVWGVMGGLRLKDCEISGTPDPACEKSFEISGTPKEVATPQRAGRRRRGALGSPAAGSPLSHGSPDFLGGA
jgi:hypothetical protein